MAILKDLIVHGSSRFLNKIYASELETPLISADAGVFKKLTAKDLIAETATVIGLLDVQGQLHTNTWTNSNIATIDGCFYITPTLSSDTGSIVFSSTSAASLTGTYTAVTSLYVGDATSGSTVQWTAGSNVLLTGQVKVNNEWIPLGTLLGTLSGNATTSAIGLTGLTDNRHNTSSIITDIRNVVGSTSINYRNLKISLYQRKDGNDSKPLGIYMTAMGTNGKTFIDIYGGVNATTTAGSSGGFADPNLRIGNLSGIPAFTTSAGTTVQPIGWGIYTTNGYFKGAVISDTGSIGGWNLTANSIWSGNSAFGNASGMYFGSSGISLGSTFKVTNAGVLTATAGTIAGWRIESTYLASGSATSPGNNILLLSPSGTSSSYTVAEEAKTGWMITAGSTFGINKDGGVYATSGKIGGWTIGTSSLYNSKSSYNNSNEGLYLGTDYIAGGAGEEWWLKKDGSAKIGAMTLSAAGVLTVPAANVSGELTAATINGSKITANTITASQIATNAITADELAANAVTADKLDATTINTSNKLTVGAMTTDTQTLIENKNIYNNKFYQYKKDITVYGDSNKYYPVYFSNTSDIYSQNDTHRISIYRGYSQKAPSDWNTSTHKGGLTLNIKWNYGGWDGATYNCEITEFTELYSTMVGDVQVAIGSGITSAIFLRGGGETGALYHIYCDVPIDTLYYNGTFPAIGNNENIGTDYMYTGSYHWTYATPLTTPNTIHIKSLIAKNTAANYITDIDSNKGITVKPADTSGNDYLQMNSSAINFYRNNVETLKIEDSAIRVGKLGNNLRNVYITDSAVQIRNNTSVLAEYGSSIKLYKPGTTTAAVEISSTGATFTGGIVATSLTLESGVTIGYSSISNPPTIPTTVAELTDSGSYLTTSAASSTYATQTNLNNEINARKAVYGTSSTDAGTATKVVTCSNFALYTGASVTVTFSKTNTSSAPQLNINSTGAKPIKSYTGANLTEGEYKWAAGASITFTYDGTNWRMQDGGALQAKIDAASSASTASSQAGVATQQATNATNAKTAAESAKTAAESAKTAAQSAKTAAETASSQASSAKDTAVSAKNDAVSAKTDAETAKGQAQTAAGNASQSATDAANSATAAAEVMGGFTILWNYSAFTSQDNGEGYLCAFDSATGTKSDANGWVKWNGIKRTITKQMINPNTVLPYNIPIYVVCRLSSATATTGTNYMVWYNSGWKYAVMPTPTAVGGSWTWTDNTDIILGKFVETASEAALTEYEIYNPPYTSKQITTNVVTAQSASASAASAAQTATTYITNIDSNNGIRIQPVNYSINKDSVQINSTAITMYRNEVDVMSLGDSSFRMGTASGKHTTVDSNGLHVWIGSESTAANEVGLFGSTARIGAPASSRFLLNADSLQAYNSSNVKYFEVSASGLSFGGNAVAKASDIPTTVAELTDSGSYATNTALTNATGWNVIINISTIDYTADTAILKATVYKDGVVQTSGFTLQWYKTETSTSTTPQVTKTSLLTGQTNDTLEIKTSPTGDAYADTLNASYTCIVS